MEGVEKRVLPVVETVKDEGEKSYNELGGRNKKKLLALCRFVAVPRKICDRVLHPR